MLTDSQRAKLAVAGVKVRLTRNRKGRTVTEQAAAQAAGGFNVWRSWDEADGIRDELYAVARRNPQLVKLEVLGRTHQNRELIALKLTQGARDEVDGSRPGVLYSSLQHAREWISVEVNRRLLHHFIARWRANDKEIKNLLKRTELWFVIVANPDGYQYTFDTDRLWRKNARDNNGDGQITVGDGVDPNRNFASRWGYDNEGSSPDEADETYRGPSAASEPETKAMQGLLDRIKPKFQSNLHSQGRWILYPQGWQVGTLDADYPIYAALAGLDADPAIPGFNPGQSADTLYVTNGETTDYADTTAGTVSFTPELGEGAPGAGFVFPDDEDLIQEEFENTLAFHMGLARSAAHPATPDSPTGIEVEPFYLDADDIDPQNGQTSLFDFKFSVSYGDPQEVRVLARRDLGAVTLRYQVNDGPVQSKPTSEWTGGQREYMFGAAITTDGGGLDPDTGDPFDVDGIDDPLAGLSWGFNGADSAQNQATNSSFIATGDFLKVTDPADSFPQFESWPAAEYQSGLAGPFDPHTGQSFMWSQRADEAYKRLTRTISVPEGGASLSFWTSFNLELDFDYLIVEAHTVGQDDWTTLPDLNGHTSNDLTDDQSCPGGWSNPDDPANVLHPFLTHYQTFQGDDPCTPTGTTGAWNAANGSSSGWQQFQVDLSAYAGSQVELSITALSDWGLQQFPGVFIDDIEVSTGEGSTSFEDDGDPTDGWTVPGAPQDDAGFEGPNRNDWVRRGGLGIKEGAVVATDDTVYMGFGLEGITGADNRNAVMARAIDYLLR